MPRIGRNPPITTPPARPAAGAPPPVQGTAGSTATPSTHPDVFESRPVAAGPIETIFTPSDEALKAELAAIDEVVAARAADPRSYPAAANPYRIEYAIYNMTDARVISRLIAASKAGVRVQVLIDAGQIGPHKPHNTCVNDLVAGGFSHAETQKGLSAEARETTQVIEIEMPSNGLFHFKSRYFTYPEAATGKTKEVLLTGSHNPQNTAHKNDESLHRISDPAVIKKYVDAFHALRDGRTIVNAWDPTSGVNALFTSPNTKGPKPVDKIFELVDNEKELVFLTVFSLRNLVSSSGARLVDRLVAAKERGVAVVVVTDRKSSDGEPLEGQTEPPGPGDLTDEQLEQAGIPVYEFRNRTGPRTAMHLKSALFGLSDMKVVTDTGNWTAATMGKGTSRGQNAESILFVESKYDDGATGVTYLSEFLRVMRKYADQNQGTGHPEIEQVVAKLQQHPAWPKVKVSFEAVAQAAAGREVFLTGPQPELAARTPDEPGLRLSGGAAEVSLPLGARFEYKVVARDAHGGVTATPGQSAVLIVDPAAQGQTDSVSVKI